MTDLNVLETITNRVDSVISENQSVDVLKALQTEVLGYKPLGSLRQVRASLYSAMNTAPARSEEKKTIKTQIANLRTLEETLATKLDDAIVDAKSRAKEVKEIKEAQENVSPVAE